MPYSYAYAPRPATPVPRQSKPKYGLLDLLSSPAALKVNEGAEYSDPDTGETFKEDPTISGQKAKLFGLIPYGANPADEVNATLAYDQISGSAANKRNIGFQKSIGALDELRAQADFVREQAKRKAEHTLGLDKLIAEKNLAVAKIRESNQAAKDFFPDLIKQIWASRAADTAGAAGRSFNVENDPNISAADQAYLAEQLLKAQGATQIKNIADKTATSVENTAVRNATRLANEANTLLDMSQSQAGQGATRFGYVGQQAMPGAQALRLAEVNLGPGQISRQPLAPLFNNPGLSYDISRENRGPIPVENAVYNTESVGDIKKSTYGGTLKNLLYDAGQADPATIRRAARNINKGQRSGGASDRGIPAALVPPTPVAAAVQPQVSPEERLSPSLMQRTGNFGFNEQNVLNPLNALRGLYNSSAYVAQGLKSGAEELGGGLQSVLQGESPYTIPPSQEHIDVLQRIKARNDANRRRKKSKQ